MKLGAALGIVGTLFAFLGADALSGTARTITCPLGAPHGVVAAAFTPVGDRLAYARGKSISVASVRGRLIASRNTSAVPAEMAWGPRGLALAYVSGDALHLVDGGDVVLFRAPAMVELGGWMTDGASLVVSTIESGPTATADPEAYLVSASGTAVRDLGPGTHAVPSPDGTRVALVTSSATNTDAQIQVIDLASGARKTIFDAAAPQLAAGATITELAWSPDSRQVALLWNIDVEPTLLAQNADRSSTGLFRHENGALPTEIGMLGPMRWTTHGIIGEAQAEDAGSLIAFYNPLTGKQHGLGIYRYRAEFLAASPDGKHVVYSTVPPDGTLAQSALRIADWPGTNDRPFLACNGTARSDRMRASAEPTTINARGGNDIVLAGNHQRDVIDCGPGIDTAFVEQRDLVRRCEHLIACTVKRARSRKAPPGIGQTTGAIPIRRCRTVKRSRVPLCGRDLT